MCRAAQLHKVRKIKRDIIDSLYVRPLGRMLRTHHLEMLYVFQCVGSTGLPRVFNELIYKSLKKQDTI